MILRQPGTRENAIETLPDEGDYRAQLARLSDDGETAAAAFDRLWRLTRGATRRLVVRGGLPTGEAEDVVQEVYLRLWRHRRTIRAKTVGEWYALVRKTTFHAVLALQPSQPLADLGDLEDIPHQDLRHLDEILLATEEGRTLYQAADDLWLGRPQNHDDAEVGAAALLLVLLHGLPATEVAAMFDGDLDRWVADPPTLNRALFAALCWPSDALADHVLGGAAWTSEERQIVLWRIQNGLSDDKIVRASGGTANPEAVLERARAMYPFPKIARDLAKALEPYDQASALVQGGLWRRIAFEYHTRLELPHRQILERAAPAAYEAGFNLTETTLNNWFGLGRLWSQLAAHLQERRP